jgi:4-amino-4-deoxy-L-arabinose transferase-like glycosyltransferase
VNPPELSDRVTRVLLTLVMVAGAVLRFWGLQFGLPHPFARPDEEVIVNIALGMLRDPNPHFFDWPSLFSYTTSAIYAVMFAVERAIGGAAMAKSVFEPALHMVTRVLSASAGVATIAALYGAARELFSRRVALLAAALLAVAFLHVRDSHFGVTDVPATFLTICGFWAGLRCFTRGATVSRAVVAGVLCGLAATTKYNCVLILLPAALAIVFRSEVRGRRSAADIIRPLTALGLSAAAAFVAGTPYALLDYPHFSAAVNDVRSHLSRGHVVMARGWLYHAQFTLRYGVGIPLLVCAVAGAWWLATRDRRKASLILSFPLSYYVILGSGLTVFVRYMIPIVPFLCLLAAVAIEWFAERMSLVSGRERLHDVIAAVLAAGVMVPTTIADIRFDRLMTATDTRVLAADWIASTFPSGLSMYQNGFGYAHALPRPPERYLQYAFNEGTNRFELDGRDEDAPDLIVILESPLSVYTSTPGPITGLAADRYTLLRTFEGIGAQPSSDTLYDQDDAFFAPYSGIEHVRRPGPAIRIYERRR